MIDPATSRAITATCVAWLAAKGVSPAARSLLQERLDVLTRPHATDLDAGDLVRAAVVLSRAGPSGLDVAAAERSLERAIFDFFLDRSEDAALGAGLDPSVLNALGLRPGNDKAA